jgi:hypothetical protein
VDWHEVDGSKVNPLQDAIRMFIAVFRIRRNNAGFLRQPLSGERVQRGYPTALSQAEQLQESS